MTIASMQLGKQGLTDNFISTLKSCFLNHKDVKIHVLKSACRDRDELKKMKDKILAGLGQNYTLRIVGYTLFIKKWRKGKVLSGDK